MGERENAQSCSRQSGEVVTGEMQVKSQMKAKSADKGFRD